jgi:hypothetical protein
VTAPLLFVAGSMIVQPERVTANTVTYRFFDAKTAATFRAAAECVVPPESGSPGGEAEQVLLVADRMIGMRSPSDRHKIATFLRALELLPIVRYGRCFSALPAEQRGRVLAFLSNTRLHPLLRVGTFGVRTYALMGYYGSELAWAELRYPGPRGDAPAAPLGKTTP